MMSWKIIPKLFTFFTLSFLSYSVFAQDLDFEIIPAAASSGVQADVKSIAESPGKVRDTYNEIAKDPKRSLGDQMATGIMNWDTILDYVVYLVKFLSQLGLLIGACMFIYAGYMYATQIMGGDEGKGKNAMKYAIIGVVVLSFSFALLKILTNMFIQ